MTEFSGMFSDGLSLFSDSFGLSSGFVLILRLMF